MASNSFFYESANDRSAETMRQREPASSFAPYMTDETNKSFDERYNELCEQYMERGYDIKRDAERMFRDQNFMNTYRKDLMTPIEEAYKALNQNDPHCESVISAFNDFWDNKVRGFNESASQLYAFLPISTLEFPVLAKQWYSSPMNDLIEVRTTKTPLYRRHVRTTYMVNNQTGEKYEYPRCMFDGTWEAIFEASRGLPIRHDAIMFDQGRAYNYDIISNLTDGNPQLDKIGNDTHIVGIIVGNKPYFLPGDGITFDFSIGGAFVNGKINRSFDGTLVQDELAGSINMEAGTISCASINGQIQGIILDGHLTNEKNLRSVSVSEKREIKQFEIPSEGPRYSMPFSIEEIEDANALLDINYYNRMVDEMVKVQEMQESQSVLRFLRDEFKKYNGVNTDVLNLESFAREYTVDLNPPRYFAGNPFEYITDKIQFQLKAVLHRIINTLKLQGLSFVISGNPMACQLMQKFTEWKVQNGTNMGGITVNHSYGFATDLGASVRVVASNVFDPYSQNAWTSKDMNGQEHTQRELVLDITGYPTDKEHISFEHVKYTSHVFTNQDSAYLSPQAPGGAAKIVMMTSRFTDISIQGIQARLILLNSDTVYNDPPVVGSGIGWPWGESNAIPVAGH